MKLFQLLGLSLLCAVLLSCSKPPITQQSITSKTLGELSVSKPLWGSTGMVLAFLDTKTLSAQALRQQLAELGMSVVIIDSKQFLQSLPLKGQCLDAQNISSAISTLTAELPKASARRLLLAGIEQGALIPFINAQASTGNNATNVSIAFSAQLPTGLNLCAPWVMQNNTLVSAPALKNNWRVVWTDQPPTETALLIKNLGVANTRIADYDTPLDKVLIDEVSNNFAQTATDKPSMPVVELPTGKPNDTVTLFYSGDGGWRDLDKTVAGEMVALNYPVVGIDVLRYFWQHQSPQQAANDLTATMAYYRKNWGAKRFVLAGYSFGADILPFIYNRLSKADQDSVPLMVLLALADSADFEIHVSGWLGKGGGEQALAPELAKIPNSKLLCIFGKEEEIETACRKLINTEAVVLELAGGHHFDEDYPKLTQKILAVYQQHGIN